MSEPDGNVVERVTMLEATVIQLRGAVEDMRLEIERKTKVRGAPSLIDNLLHVYAALPMPSKTTPLILQATPEGRAFYASLGEASRTLRAVLISLGVAPEGLQ
jgi:hypothetical protein